MKRFFTYVAICCTIFLSSCNISDINDSNNTPQSSDKELCLVSINPVGEITTTGIPMSKSDIIMTNDVYCVYVHDNTSNKPFAAGYFDNLESMKLYLKKGATYRIQVAMIKDAKKLLDGDTRYNATQNSLSSDSESDVFTLYFSRLRPYYQTSYISSAQYEAGTTFKYYYKDSSNCTVRSYFDGMGSEYGDYKVPYTSNYFPINHYYYQASSSEERGYTKFYLSKDRTALDTMTAHSFTLPYIEYGRLSGVDSPSCTDWFYGEESDYTPIGDYESLNLNFSRVGFKLKYELSGVTDGEVTVKIYTEINGEERVYVENTTNTSTYTSGEQFIAFYNTQAAWEYANDSYAEGIKVSVVWKRGIGITQDLGEKIIQVKRNCLNNIRITLGSDDRDSGISLTTENDTSYGGSSSTDIPVEG